MQAPHATDISRGNDSAQRAQVRVGFHPASQLGEALRSDRTLAVFGFGLEAREEQDPRWLHVPLADAGPGRIELWRSAQPVRHGRTGAVRWSENGNVLFGSLEPDEDGRDLADTTADAYATLSAFLASSGFPYLLRTWNYLDAVTAGDGDDERYRRFCIGRARGWTLRDGEFPAATCIGRHDGRRRLQLAWLAARTPGRPLENPRQTSAYRYPRQYGPQAPSFARALLPAASSEVPLLLSGTAAIVGHASQHPGALEQQLDETLVNLQHLIDAARPHATHVEPGFAADTALRIYVRNEADMATVAERFRQRFGHIPHLVLNAEICRPELLVEIEGVHA